MPSANRGVSATSKAWSILQGESPCRERSSQPPVSSVAFVAEHRDRIIPSSQEKTPINERTKQTKRRACPMSAASAMGAQRIT
ncbi:MAG: hypothetical protein GY820_04235 [Gammaproteobacteria bacterium]|nr:hypothetical protein [Gammaproteobacteria bacterium]